MITLVLIAKAGRERLQARITAWAALLRGQYILAAPAVAGDDFPR
jgi:hypothetical protein